MNIILIAFSCTLVNYVYGANILIVMPVPAYSHTNAYMPIFTELARRGHNVTMVSPYPQKKPIPNFNDFVLENTLDKVLSGLGASNDIRINNFMFKFLGIWPMCKAFLDPIFNMPQFQQFLYDENSKFDLVILEVFFCQQPFLAFGQKYGVPVVSMVSPAINPTISEASGNPFPMAYVPNMKLPFTDHMTFYERVVNTLTTVLEIFIDEFYGNKIMDSYMREHFRPYPGFQKLPTVSEMQRNISLFMLDNHFSLNYQRPYLPNVVEFGGLSLKSAGKLPSDLGKLMNESREGVIFISWGSHYPMTNMAPKLRSALMSVLGKLKQTVLMKWENETLPGKPENVKIDRWFPQSSIIAHPNTHLFITHGGIHGVTEAVFNAVPMLGTPLFADHFYNLRMAEEAGMALNVDVDKVTEAELYTTIKKLLDDPKFKWNARRKSSIMKDRPQSELGSAIYWIEYVIRHNGARHLRSGSMDLTWYQNLLLDVVAALLAALIAIILFLVYSVKLLCKLFKTKNEPKGKKERKKGKKSKKD